MDRYAFAVVAIVAKFCVTFEFDTVEFIDVAPSNGLFVLLSENKINFILINHSLKISGGFATILNINKKIVLIIFFFPINFISTCDWQNVIYVPQLNG